MHIDRYRTSRRESRKDNCHCGVWHWSAKGGPHNRRSCQAKIKRDSKELRNRVLAGLPPPWLFKHSRRKYVEQKILATPPWVSHKEMMALHHEKLRLTEQTGIPHRLDHIIPLNHPMICGLNVPWNIQIITHWQNARKGNRFNPEQLELLQ